MILFASLIGCIDFALDKIQDPTPEGLRELSVDPGLVDYGLLTSPAPITATVTVTAAGDVPTTISAIDVTGSSAYTLTLPAEDLELAPGDTFPIVVTYQPMSAADEAQLVVHSDATEPQLVVQLLGGGLYPAILIEPTSMYMLSGYGESVTEEVMVTSVGTADLDISLMVVQGEQFTAEMTLPVTLAPGESVPLSATYTPLVQGESVTGKIWLTTNTQEGFAIVPLEGEFLDPCIGLGEAWDTEALSAVTLNDGLTFRLENLSTDKTICVDDWYLFLSEESQDMGVGDMDADFGDAYPVGSLEMAPGESLEFEADALAGNAWYCVELTQYTQRNATYEFIGAYVPDPLITYMLAGDQQAVWDYQDANPMVAMGRDTNFVHVGEAGGEAPVSARILNMGDGDVSATVREVVPQGYVASNFSPEPLRTETSSDGDSVYVFEVALDARIKTGAYEHTIYDEAHITYTLAVPPCRGRTALPSATAAWVDDWDESRISYANPLVVLCED